MRRIRSGGLEGSSGRYAAPAFQVAKAAIANSGERSRNSATRLSRFAPSDFKYCARALERASSSAYEIDSVPTVTAGAAGVSVAQALTISGTEAEFSRLSVLAPRAFLVGNASLRN